MSETSDSYNFGHEEGYKAGYDKGWADYEYKQQGAIKKLTQEMEELREDTAVPALETKIGELLREIEGLRSLHADHRACTCRICEKQKDYYYDD